MARWMEGETTVVRVRVWLRLARRPLRLTLPAAWVRVRGVKAAGRSAVMFTAQVKVNAQIVWWVLALMHTLALADRLGVLTVDALEVSR